MRQIFNVSDLEVGERVLVRSPGATSFSEYWVRDIQGSLFVGLSRSKSAPDCDYFKINEIELYKFREE